MASSAFKPKINKFIEPIARGLLAIGITPNAITLVGACGSSLSAAILFTQGHLMAGVIAVAIFTLSDLLDGTMARVSTQGATRWGGFIDSVADRFTDSAIMGGVIIYLVKADDRLSYLAIASLVVGFLIPYIRAKSESLGIACTVGIAERTERLILVLTAIGLEGLGIEYALAIGMWILLVLSLITVGQRVFVVYKGLKN